MDFNIKNETINIENKTIFINVEKLYRYFVFDKVLNELRENEIITSDIYRDFKNIIRKVIENYTKEGTII